MDVIHEHTNRRGSFNRVCRVLLDGATWDSRGGFVERRRGGGGERYKSPRLGISLVKRGSNVTTGGRIATDRLEPCIEED